MLNEKMNDIGNHSSLKNELECESTFHERLVSLVEEVGNPNAFANKVGVSPSGIHRLMEGGTPGMPLLIKICDAFNISSDWLSRGIGERYLSSSAINSSTATLPTTAINTLGEEVDLAEFIFIPRYNVSASAGFGSDISKENVMHSMAFRKYWVDNVLGVCAKSLIVIGVKGDSMEGVINDGDVILINSEDKHLNNGIYVIRINGDLIVKRTQMLPGGKVEITSANSNYRAFEINLHDLPADFGVIGRVVWHGRNVP